MGEITRGAQNSHKVSTIHYQSIWMKIKLTFSKRNLLRDVSKIWPSIHFNCNKSTKYADTHPANVISGLATMKIRCTPK